MMLASLAPGSILHNRYCLVAVAGQGTFGQTYLARDQKRQNQLCVLKEFTPPEQELEALQALWNQFHQAASILYDLHHPQLPGFQVMIAQGQRFYWVREFIPGKSYGMLLAERQAAGQAFSEAEVLQLLEQVLPVLQYLHRHGVIHQNLSPDSIVQRQSDQLPVLINFGLVHELVMRLQLHPIDPSLPLESWHYAPPEQRAIGEVFPHSDLYALAVVAIVLLTGKPPEELYDQVAQVYDWEQWILVNPKFGRLLRQMLHPNPKKRPASAEQVMQALQAILHAPPTLTPPPAPELESGRPEETQKPEETPAAAIAQTAPAVPARLRVKRHRKLNRDFFTSAALMSGVALLVAALSWRIVSAVVRERTTAPSAPRSASSSAPVAPTEAAPPTPTPSPSQASSPAALNSEALRERRRKLGVEYSFFTNLVDEVFYEQYPQLKQRRLGSDAEQTRLQGEWAAIASTLMDKLETLQPETRSKLGSYRRSNYDQWLKALGETGASSRLLDGLADARFFELFPEQKGKTLAPRTFGQVWYGIAEEQLSVAKAQKAAGSARSVQR